MTHRPNILWICTDQQRFDTIAALGNSVIRTPHLDRLCAEGVAFTHTYCQNPICTPSRASFLTGLYPNATHVHRNGNSHYPIEGPKLITRRLADAGYTCGLVGKLHIASAWNGEEARTDDGYSFYRYSHAPHQHAGTRFPGAPLPPPGASCQNAYIDWLREQKVDFDKIFIRDGNNGFHSYRPDADPEIRQTTWCANEAIRFMQSHRDGTPWLLSVNIYDPHPPFDGPEVFQRHYENAALPGPLFRESDLEWQSLLEKAGVFFQTSPKRPDAASTQDIASYYAMIELIDQQVGRMLDTLETTGQRERTVVIFHSDHGEMLGDHGLLNKGCRFYDGLVRVPMIISCPGRFRQGAQCKELVELTDVAPTLADLAGVELPWTHGRSLKPFLEEATSPAIRDFVRCEYFHTLDRKGMPETEAKNRAYGTMYFDGRWKLSVYHGHGLGELYDLQNDPSEFENRWNDPSVAEIKAVLMEKSLNALATSADLGPERIGRF